MAKSRSRNTEPNREALDLFVAYLNALREVESQCMSLSADLLAALSHREPETARRLVALMKAQHWVTESTNKIVGATRNELAGMNQRDLINELHEMQLVLAANFSIRPGGE